MTLGSFTFVVDGTRANGDAEDTARVRIDFQNAAMLVDGNDLRFEIPEPGVVELPFSVSLPTDVTEGASEVIGYTARVSTKYGGSETVKFAAPADGETVYFASVLEQTLSAPDDSPSAVAAMFADAENVATVAMLAAVEAAGIAGGVTDYTELDNLPTLGTAAAEDVGAFEPSGAVAAEAAARAAADSSLTTAVAAKADAAATTTALAAKADTSALAAHTGNTANPHAVTKAQVGLANVDNTSDANKPVSTATTTALALKADAAATTTALAGKVPTTRTVGGLDLSADRSAADVVTALATALNAAYAGRQEIANSDLAALQDPVSLSTGTAYPIGTVDGVLYGVSTDGTSKLYRSTDDGSSWTLVANAFASTGGPLGIAKMGNGEVMVITAAGAWRSTGWAANPLTATWTLAATPTPNNGGFAAATFIHSTWDVYGQYVLLTEYVNPKHNSRKVMLSTDYGVTFTTVWDKTVLYPAEEDVTHMHSCAIDPWAGATPRLWIVKGDGGTERVFYSDNLGSSWTLFTNGGTSGFSVTGLNLMTMTATPAGMVLTTDVDGPDGVYRILRTANPANMVLERMLHLPYVGDASGSLIGFGVKSWRDPNTNLVWMTFNTTRPAAAGSPDLPGYVFVSDGKRAAVAWTTPETSDSTSSVVTEGVGVTTSGKVVVSYRYGAGSTLKAVALTYGGRGSNKSYAEMNQGNALTGYSLSRGAVAIGPYVTAPIRSVLIGAKATYTDTSGTSTEAVAVGAGAAVGTDAVAIGYKANAAQTRSIVIGSNTTAAGSDAVIIGASVTSTGANNVGIGKGITVGNAATVVGYQASVTGTSSTAYGNSSSASNNNAVSVGHSATTSQSGCIAIGQGSNSGGVDNIAIGRAANTTTWQRSIVIGAGLTSTESDQVLFGTKHFEWAEISADPSAPAADKIRLYIKDNGSGKTQLCARFNTGAVQVIATQP